MPCPYHIYCQHNSFFIFLGLAGQIHLLQDFAHAEEQGKIAENIAQTFINIVVSRGEIFFTLIMLFGIICGLIVFGLIRLTATLQLSCPVELRDAVEFRQAMEKLGITDPHDRIDFVRKHYVQVYIAFKPITGFMRNNVNARLYAFSDSAPFGSRKIFNTYIGSQRLCLDERDYKYLLENFEQTSQIAQLAQIGSLEDTIARLKGHCHYSRTRFPPFKSKTPP